MISTMALTRRSFLTTAAASAATIAAGVAGIPRAAWAQAYSAYVMAYFTESPDMQAANYGLHLAVSQDGLSWTPLNQNDPVATPTAGTQGLRDPFVYRKQDGGFVVVATDLSGTNFGQNNQFLHAWDSTNLTSFTGYRRIQMHSMNNTHTWAPTAFWDSSRGQYGIVYSAANSGQDVLMVNYTSDFQNVSAPQVFFSPGFDVLDGDIVVGGGTTYLYYKNLADGNLYGARSATGAPNSFTTYTSGLRQGDALEGPLLLKANQGNGWWLWGDSFLPVNGEYYVWSTSDIGADTWSLVNQRDYTPPLNAKHGSIQPITSAEYNALVSAWGSPDWVRLKSSNIRQLRPVPGRRHVLSGRRARRRGLVLVPLVQLPRALPQTLRLRAAHRRDQHKLKQPGPAGRHLPGHAVTTPSYRRRPARSPPPARDEPLEQNEGQQEYPDEDLRPPGAEPPVEVARGVMARRCAGGMALTPALMQVSTVPTAPPDRGGAAPLQERSGCRATSR